MLTSDADTDIEDVSIHRVYTVLFACERVRVEVRLWIRHRFGLKSTDKTVVHFLSHTQSLSLSIKHNVKL